MGFWFFGRAGVVRRGSAGGVGARRCTGRGVVSLRRSVAGRLTSRTAASSLRRRGPLMRSLAYRAAVACGLSARAAAGLLVLIFMGGMVFGPGVGRLSAQEDEGPGSQDVALLNDGPELVRGLPFLPANVIPHYRGHYEYQKSDIEVFYTEREIVRFSDWQAANCGRYRLYRVSRVSRSTPASQSAGADDQIEGVRPIVTRPVFLYQTDEYSLFIRVEQQYLCTFFSRFMSKFIYFRSVENIPSSRPPFPAVVD